MKDILIRDSSGIEHVYTGVHVATQTDDWVCVKDPDAPAEPVVKTKFWGKKVMVPTKKKGKTIGFFYRPISVTRSPT